VTIPPLPPVTAPGLRVEAKILIALVAYRSQDGSAVPLSWRYVQLFLVRGNKASCGTALRRLVATGWLGVVEKPTAVRPTRYRLGTAIQGAEAELWTAFGIALFDPADGYLTDRREGSLGHLSVRPAAKFGYLGMPALVVLEACRRFGPVAQRDLVAAFAPLMTRSGLCDRGGVLRRLERHGLLVRTEGNVFATPVDVEDRLQTYEDESGATAKAEQTRRNIAVEQRLRDDRWLGSERIRALKAHLRTQPCGVCGRQPVDGDGEVEHWPPRRLGGYDAVGRIRPICRGCNGMYSDLIRSIPESAISSDTEPLTVVTDDPEDLKRFTGALLDLRYLEFQLAFADDDPDRVSEGLEITDLLWRAVHGHGRPTTVVESSTGEVTEVPPVDPADVFLGPPPADGDW
jgi:hypothetical protein